jgi:predicted nucleotidyltransferase
MDSGRIAYSRPNGRRYTRREDVVSYLRKVSHLAFSAVSDARPSAVLEVNRGVINELVAASGVLNPRVFGSVARGEDTPDSDLDLLVSVPESAAWDFLSLEDDLRAALGIKVDVVDDGGLRLPEHAQILLEAVPL